MTKEKKITYLMRFTQEEKDSILKQMRRENFTSLNQYLKKLALDRVKSVQS